MSISYTEDPSRTYKTFGRVDVPYDPKKLFEKYIKGITGTYKEAFKNYINNSGWVGGSLNANFSINQSRIGGTKYKNLVQVQKEKPVCAIKKKIQNPSPAPKKEKPGLGKADIASC